jgi:hypothetical protein
LVNDPLEDALLAHPQNCHKPQVPLDAILRSLWHIRRFCGDLWEIPCISPDVKARVYRAILLRIFRSWDQCKTCDLPSSAIFMVDSLRSFVIDEKVCVRFLFPTYLNAACDLRENTREQLSYQMLTVSM